MIVFFFFNDTATTEIYTLSLHDALPIFAAGAVTRDKVYAELGDLAAGRRRGRDRKSTRLNSSHDQISYAVFCLKKKKDDNKCTRCFDYGKHQSFQATSVFLAYAPDAYSS